MLRAVCVAVRCARRDNKGPMLAFIFAVKEMVESAKEEGSKGLPLNVCFIFEGGRRGN